MAVGAVAYLGKTPDFLGLRYTYRVPYLTRVYSDSATMFSSSRSSYLHGPNLIRAESVSNQSSPRAPLPRKRSSMVVSRLRISMFLCLISLASFELVTSAELTFQLNQKNIQHYFSPFGLISSDPRIVGGHLRQQPPARGGG